MNRFTWRRAKFGALLALGLVFEATSFGAGEVGEQSLPKGETSEVVHGYVKQLKETLQTKGEDALAERINTFEVFRSLEQGTPTSAAQTEVISMLAFLNKHALETGSSRWIYFYSAHLFKAGWRGNATQVYFAALYKAMWDGARCADKSATNARVSLFSRSLGPHFYAYAKGLNDKDLDGLKVKIKTTVDGFMRETSHDKGDEWVCRGGAGYYSKYFERHPEIGNKTIGELSRESSNNGNVQRAEVKKEAGRTSVVLPPDPTIKPDFVSDEQWLEAREEAAKVFWAMVENTWSRLRQRDTAPAER